MTSIKLSVKDRLLLPGLLPEKGKRIEMIIADSIYKAVEFNASEVQEFELKDLAGGGVAGNPKRFRDTDIQLTAEQVNLLKQLPKRLDEAGNITRELLPLLNKIDAMTDG